MPPHRDVAAFEERARGYEKGWHGRLHHDIADRAVALALKTVERPKSVLDVGCGTGYMLRQLARRCPDANELVGVDPAPAMIEGAIQSADDARLGYSVAVAERLPYPDDTFELVVSTTSFDHWSDQRAGLDECARVLMPGGQLVLVDQFPPWLAATLLLGQRDKARTKRRTTHVLEAAGFQSIVWQNLYAVVIKAVTATI